MTIEEVRSRWQFCEINSDFLLLYFCFFTYFAQLGLVAFRGKRIMYAGAERRFKESLF